MAAGDTYTIFKPRIFIAERTVGSFPAMGLPLGGAWPDGWFQVKHTEEGVSISSTVDKEDIESDEADQPLGVVPTGSQINISWTTVAPTLQLVDFLGNMKKTSVAGQAEVASLTISSAPTTAGNVIVTLDGTSTSIAVATTDTADGVATKIRGTAFAGWTTGGTGATVTFTADTVGNKGDAAYDANGTGTTGTMTTPTQGYNTYEKHNVVLEGTRFMVGIEGEYGSGGLTDNGGFIRAFAYNVEQTEDFEMRLSRKGSDAAFRPAAAVRCLPGKPTAAQLDGTGIVDPDDAFDLIVVPTA